LGGRPGGIFEIFQNGHIFLKFLFFKNIKKKKAQDSDMTARMMVPAGLPVAR
jgi:hypothetical protein